MVRVLLLLACACCVATAGAVPLTFTVNSSDDVPDVDPGDGVCETATGNGVCTLRGAIQESNIHVGSDKIVLQPNVTYMLSRVGQDGSALAGDLDVNDSVTITGAGPTTVIDGNGGVLAEGVFSFAHCVRNNTTKDGTCVEGLVAATLSGLTIQHGYSTGLGGGINNAAFLDLRNCVITANTANGTNGWGGGIANFGNLTLVGSVVSGNSIGGGNSFGGGIINLGYMTIDSTTISNNAISGLPGLGGGVYSNGQGETVIVNSTISGNSAVAGAGIYTKDIVFTSVNTTISGNASSGDGGGVYSKSGQAGFYNVTIAQNSANSDEFKSGSTGGGLFNEAGGLVYIANSIIAANVVLVPTGGKPIRDPDQCAGTLNSFGNNLLSDIDLGHCTMTGAYALTPVSLGPLQNNGGPTRTHALLAGSAAIDAGNTAGCVDGNSEPITKDQRGVRRPFGSYCDAGALEASDTIFFNRFEIGI